MGRYCSVGQVAARFRKVSDVLSYPDAVDSEFIRYAENELDSRLGAYFTLPFSSNNLTATDLAIDMAYGKIVRYSDPKLYASIMKSVGARIDDLIVGSAVMLTTSGDAIDAAASAGQAWSNTASYHSAFGMDDAPYQQVSSAQLYDEEQARL